jgi:hypothetical protein
MAMSPVLNQNFMKATVKYQIATYSGTISVDCDPDDENDRVIAKAKQKLQRLYGPLPFGYESFKVIQRDE